MRINASTLVLLAMLVAPHAVAEMYKCSENGRTVFQEHPCKGGGGEIKVRPQSGEAQPTRPAGNNLTGQAAPDDRLSAQQAQLAAMEKSRKSREVEFQIKVSEREIRDLEREQERELEALREKKAYARNNLAGATWEQSISTEMQSVVERYKSRIGMVNSRIDRQRKELEALK